MSPSRVRSQFARDDRSLALAPAGEPSRAATTIGVETRAVARSGFMQQVMLDLAYAAVSRARLGQPEQFLVLTGAAERMRLKLGHQPLPIIERLRADHLRGAVDGLGPAAAGRARQLADTLELNEALELACAPLLAP